jgi:hypothetical protein
MSKYRAYKGPKRPQRATPNAIPCLVLVFLGLMLILFLLYYAMQVS